MHARGAQAPPFFCDPEHHTPLVYFWFCLAHTQSMHPVGAAAAAAAAASTAAARARAAAAAAASGGVWQQLEQEQQLLQLKAEDLQPDILNSCAS